MLQYGEIIEKLSIDEKLSILTDGRFLASLHAENEDIPALDIRKLTSFNGAGEYSYPAFGALANTWDCTLIELVAKVVGYEGEIAFDHVNPDGTPQKLLDISKLKSLGWTPKYSLEEGLKATYAAYLKEHA